MKKIRSHPTARPCNRYIDNPNTIGDRDFALITDFGNTDNIQLAGSQDMYSLGTSAVNGNSGTGIFLNEGQNTPELIGVVEDIFNTLALDDTTQFTFV